MFFGGLSGSSFSLSGRLGGPKHPVGLMTPPLVLVLLELWPVPVPELLGLWLAGNPCGGGAASELVSV